MTMSNVIDLGARRRQKAGQPAAERRRGANILAASGVVALLPSAGLLAFVAYQAIRLQILADTFVLGLFIALSAYLVVGGALIRRGKRLSHSISQQARLQEYEDDEPAEDESEERDNPFLLVEFPTAGPISGGLISIRCSSCANRYLASRTNLLCPTCGRAAMAG